MRNLNKLLLFILGILLISPAVLNVYFIYLFDLIGIAIILAVGLNFVLGLSGQMSLCHAAFYGQGAYTTALLMAKLSWPFWIALPVGAFSALGLGVLVGFPALRLSGPYLALVTLSFGEIFQLILVHWVGLTNGPLGLVVPHASIFGIGLGSDASLFYLISVSCVLLIFFAYNFIDSKMGRALIAIRQSEIGAQSMGVYLAKYKLIAFGLSAFYAGFAGGLHACLSHFVDPMDFGLWQSITYLTMVIIGGVGSLLGAIIGAIIITVLPEILGGLLSFQEMAYGFILLLFLIYLPNGISGKIKFNGLGFPYGK